MHKYFLASLVCLWYANTQANDLIHQDILFIPFNKTVYLVFQDSVHFYDIGAQ